jgi:hypothetical protein
MAIEVYPVPARETPASSAVRESASVDERWAAWLAKGAAHDRVARRSMVIAAPIVIVVALILYALLAR